MTPGAGIDAQGGREVSQTEQVGDYIRVLYEGREREGAK